MGFAMKFRAVLLLACLGGATLAAGQAPLTRAEQVRALPADAAATGVPVELEAVVGLVESSGTVFVQDASGGTFFRTQPAAAAVLAPGDRVHLRGRSVPGLYLPGIEAETFEVRGRGAPPEAVAAAYDDLVSGRYHYQRVVVEGVGRRVAAEEENRSIVFLALGSRVLEVRVDAPPEELLLTDARLRVTGLAAGGINDRRQLVFPYLRVGAWTDIEVLEPAPTLEQSPRISAARLLRFDPVRAPDSGHRVRVAGTVLAALPDGQVFLRDLTAEEPPRQSGRDDPSPAQPPRPAALAVRLVAPATLQPGQFAEVAGFSNMEGFSASLMDAVLVQAEAGPADAAPAVPVSGPQLMEGGHDADLVTLDAELADRFRTPDGQELRLLAGGVALRARLSASEGLDTVQPGSRVRVTGICRVETSRDRGFRSRPERVMLLLRGPEDVLLLNTPSWWTAGRLVAAIGLLSALLALVLLWSTLLRRQVTRQAAALSERIARQATLEERQRIAREFHDTLEQELAGLNLRLDAALTRPLEDKARGLLDASRHLVARLQSEARNLVSDLRAGQPAGLDLATELGEITHRLTGDGMPELQVQVDCPVPPLPAAVVHHLRMIAQEAVTNALKHADASAIRITLGREGSALLLSVTDDGRGLAPGATEPRPGHFGCMGIRERCQKIGAEPEWRSGPDGRGTQLRISLPCPEPWPTPA